MGYHQIKVKEFDIRFISFVIDRHQWEYVRLPFGLTNAPYTFQKAITHRFRNHNFLKFYLDDIIIFFKDEETHFKHIT